jgi:hypothetical protein
MLSQTMSSVSPTGKEWVKPFWVLSQDGSCELRKVGWKRQNKTESPTSWSHRPALETHVWWNQQGASETQMSSCLQSVTCPMIPCKPHLQSHPAPPQHNVGSVELPWVSLAPLCPVHFSHASFLLSREGYSVARDSFCRRAGSAEGRRHCCW